MIIKGVHLSLNCYVMRSTVNTDLMAYLNWVFLKLLRLQSINS